METAIIIFKCLLLAKFITSFEPFQWLIDLLPNNIGKYILVVLTSCLKCCAFWTTLLISGDIFIAAGAFYIAYLYYYLEDYLLRKLHK